MSLNLKDIVGNIFYTDKKEEENENEQTTLMQNKLNNILGTNDKAKTQSFNPYLKSNGELYNPYINYQQLLDSSRVSDKAKQYITQATGLKQQVYPSTQSSDGTSGNTGGNTQAPLRQGTGAFKNLVGQRITDTSKYNNGAAFGQCVWYVLGRASEVNGKNITIGGNGNSMTQYAKSGSVYAPVVENLRGNMLLSYNKGTSTAGQKYGHVIFIEDVDGDTVYYTEGGSGYHKNGTDGVVKTATREQILDGVNSSGAKIGSEPVGLIDLSKY